MRPVERGAALRVYTKYQDAGPDLQARLGDYCSYCERQIETNLAVEGNVPCPGKSWFRTAIEAAIAHHEAEKEGVNILLERGRTPYDVLTKALVYLKSGDNK